MQIVFLDRIKTTHREPVRQFFSGPLIQIIESTWTTRHMLIFSSQFSPEMTALLSTKIYSLLTLRPNRMSIIRLCCLCLVTDEMYYSDETDPFCMHWGVYWLPLFPAAKTLETNTYSRYAGSDIPTLVITRPGVPREKLGGGVRPASQKPHPIYDQNLWFSILYLWPNPKSIPIFRPALNLVS